MHLYQIQAILILGYLILIFLYAMKIEKKTSFVLFLHKLRLKYFFTPYKNNTYVMIKANITN